MEELEYTDEINGNYVEVTSTGDWGKHYGYVNGEQVVVGTPARGQPHKAMNEVKEAIDTEAKYADSDPLDPYERVKRYLEFNEGEATLRELMENTFLDKTTVYRCIDTYDRKEMPILDEENPTFRTLDIPDNIDRVVKLMSEDGTFMKGIREDYLVQYENMSRSEARGAIHKAKQQHDVQEYKKHGTTYYYIDDSS